VPEDVDLCAHRAPSLLCRLALRRRFALARPWNVRRVVIHGGPNAIIWTHAGQVNHARLDFIADDSS
jgi:hypothetical protein